MLVPAVSRLVPDALNVCYNFIQQQNSLKIKTIVSDSGFHLILVCICACIVKFPRIFKFPKPVYDVFFNNVSLYVCVSKHASVQTIFRMTSKLGKYIEFLLQDCIHFDTKDSMFKPFFIILQSDKNHFVKSCN